MTTPPTLNAAPQTPITPLQVTYATLALAGLIGTWGFNLEYLRTPGADALGFVAGGFANPAASSLTVDLVTAATAFLFWSNVEARRLRLRSWWWVPVVTLAIAFAVAFPLFLLQRDRALQGASAQR